ncbi:hypothetical protein CAG99_10340 [Streptomyces marincola]|uniref:Uncharacterized protein n=1 Tax=Streptomyces marincola TaxID=2878388 RepID=A0A1W7CXZ9_9ACTN|nr:hypothetical protein CAG99_10340 [Streptomyces marincola]
MWGMCGQIQALFQPRMPFRSVRRPEILALHGAEQAAVRCRPVGVDVSPASRVRSWCQSAATREATTDSQAPGSRMCARAESARAGR